MTNIEIITLVAIVLGPIGAVLVGQYLHQRAFVTERRQKVFKDLMSTRSIPMHPDHVRALNMIDVEFSGDSKKDIATRDAWVLYNTQLGNIGLRDADIKQWVRENDNKLNELLDAMAVALGYKLNRSQISQGSYAPQLYGNIDNDWSQIRQGLIHMLNNDKFLKVVLEEANHGKSSEEFIPHAENY